MSIGSVPKYIMKIVIYIENKNLFCVKILHKIIYSKGTYLYLTGEIAFILWPKNTNGVVKT